MSTSVPLRAAIRLFSGSLATEACGVCVPSLEVRPQFLYKIKMGWQQDLRSALTAKYCADEAFPL